VPPGPRLYSPEDWSTLKVFEKNFYLEHPAVTSRAEPMVASFRATREIAVSGRDVPKPCTSFDEGVL
jgi:ATP-dependent RNA helicase DDX5/DBP2